MADVNVAEETSMLEALEEQARSLGSGPSEWYEFRQQPLDNIFAVLAVGGQSGQAARKARADRAARVARTARAARVVRAARKARKARAARTARAVRVVRAGDVRAGGPGRTGWLTGHRSL